MARYLDIGKQVMQELEAKRTTSEPSPVEVQACPSPLVPAELLTWPIDRQELWPERAAILEYDAGLPRDAAEQTAIDLCQPTVAPGPAAADEPLEVGHMCPRCRDDGRIAHLYVRREGCLWCVQCLRRGGCD